MLTQLLSVTAPPPTILPALNCQAMDLHHRLQLQSDECRGRREEVHPFGGGTLNAAKKPSPMMALPKTK